MPVFLFTDIENSTQLWERYSQAMALALARHDAILEELVSAHGGRIIRHRGDGISAVFEAGTPLACAVVVQKRFTGEDWGEIGELRLRLALHAGEAERREFASTTIGQKEEYFGPVLNRTARILDTGWGGQILLTPEVISICPLPAGASLQDLGIHLLKNLETPQQIYGLSPSALAVRTFPPLRSLARADTLPPPCPYRGLFAFRAEDAPFFFGREAFTERLVAAVHQQALTAVIGPSGSGKSSVIFAGLVSRLCQETAAGPFNTYLGAEVLGAATPFKSPGGTGRAACPFPNWAIASFRPGSHPFRTLADSLIPLLESHLNESEQRVAAYSLADRLSRSDVSLDQVVEQLLSKDLQTGRLLLIADQFEELYTLCPAPETRHQFLDMLLATIERQQFRSIPIFSFVLDLRADFMGQALTHRPLADALQDASLILGPMTRQELNQAIENPANRQGVTFEAGLVARILDDVGDEPGNLPLLEFALTLLWERQINHQLTHAAYEAIGRAEGAVAHHADAVYSELSPAEQAQARQVLMQMVQPGAGTEDTRRLATRIEVGDSNWLLAKQLADARLVVTDRDPAGQETVEIVHEALIHGWMQLQVWMDADRAFRTWQERLRAVLRQWETSQRDEGALLRGAPLAEAEGWLAERRTDLSPTELAFIQASLGLRERRQAEREWERITRERLRQRIMWGLAVGLVVAVILALFAVGQWWRAEEQRRIALSNQLAAQALNQLDNQDFSLALLLSLAANRMADTQETRSSLLTGLQRSPYRAILRHSAPVVSAAFSRDGRTLVSATVDGTISLWDAATGQPVGQPFARTTGGVNSVAISPDGHTLASGNADGTISLWDVTTAQLIGSPLVGHTDRVESVAFSPDGRILASGSADSSIILWDVIVGQPITPPLAGHTGIIKSVAFSPDGRNLASASTIEVWGGVGNTAILWNLIGHPPEGRPLTNYTADVSSVAFSPDGRTLALGNVDGTIVLWNTATGQSLGKPFNHVSAAGTALTVLQNVKVAFSPDGRTLASGNVDGTIILWDVTTGQPRGQPLTGHSGEVTSLTFSPDGRTLASGSSDNTVILWALDQPLSQSIIHQNSRVWSMAFSPDGRTLAAGDDKRTIMRWDVTTGASIGQPLVGHTSGVNSVSFSPDGQILASGSDDGTIILWDTVTGRPIGKPLIGHSDVVNSVVFSPDGQMLASGSRDHTIILWDTATQQPLGPPLTNHTDGVWSVAFSPNGQILASGSWDQTIVLWDVATRQPLRPPLTGHTGAVVSLAFSPDGQTLASGSQDNTLILWNVATGQPLGQPLDGHSSGVWSVAFSPDGRVLASASCGQLSSYDSCSRGEIRLWDVMTSRPLGQPLPGHTDMVWSVAFSPDGRTLASASDDTTIILWDISRESWRSRACRIAGRNLTSAEWQQYLGNESYYQICPDPL